MDKSAVVASAVLVSAFHLISHSTEIVKRWSNEIQEAVHSKHSMVQFHAVALLHALRANDRLAVSKLVSSLVKGSVRYCLSWSETMTGLIITLLDPVLFMHNHIPEAVVGKHSKYVGPQPNSALHDMLGTGREGVGMNTS